MTKTDGPADPSPGAPSGMTLPGIRRNVGLDLVLAVGLGVATAAVGGLLPTIARQAGLPPLAIAVIAAAPFLANFLGAFAGRAGPRSTAQLALVRGIGASLLIGLALTFHPLVIVAVALLYWLTVSFSGPYQFRLWAVMYPSRMRGRVVGLLGTGRTAAAGVAAVVLGLFADRLGVSPALAVAGVVGVACAVAGLGLRTLPIEGDGRYSARQAIGVLMARPMLRRLVLAQGFYGGGLIAAAPLYALVYVDRLHLPLAQVGTIAVVGAVASTASYTGLGAFVDRRGAPAALRLGSVLGCGSLVGYAFAPSLQIIWLAAAAAGVAGAAIDLGIQGAIGRQTRTADRAAAMAGWNSLTGARGVVAPLIMGGLVQAGLLDLTVGLVVCVIPAAVGVALYAAIERDSAPHRARAHDPVPGRGLAGEEGFEPSIS